jgi:hypothetical protein
VLKMDDTRFDIKSLLSPRLSHCTCRRGGSYAVAYAKAVPARAGPTAVAASVRPLYGFEQEDEGFASWLEPPRPAVTLMIDFEGSITANGEPLPDAWIGGLSQSYTVVGVGRRYASRADAAGRLHGARTADGGARRTVRSARRAVRPGAG